MKATVFWHAQNWYWIDSADKSKPSDPFDSMHQAICSAIANGYEIGTVRMTAGDVKITGLAQRAQPQVVPDREPSTSAKPREP